MLEDYGSKVGFQIRFEKNKTMHTNILFITEGLLLRQVSYFLLSEDLIYVFIGTISMYVLRCSIFIACSRN